MVVAAGQRITAGMFPATKSATQDAVSEFTSTTYTETASTNAFPSLTFVAPTSGEVIVSLNAFLDHTVSTTLRIHLSFTIRTGGVIGSGTVFFDGGDEESISHVGQADSRMGAETHITGLTAGATYNLRVKGRVSAAASGSGQAQFQHVIVKPCY